MKTSKHKKSRQHLNSRMHTIMLGWRACWFHDLD